MTECQDCGREIRQHVGRGLCRACYTRNSRAGTLSHYQTANPRRCVKMTASASRHDYIETVARGQKCELCGALAVDRMRNVFMCRACLCHEEPQPVPSLMRAIDTRAYNGDWENPCTMPVIVGR